MRRTIASILDCRHMHESGHKSQAPHVSPREPQVGGGIVLSHVHETHSTSARWFPAVFVESAWLHVKQRRIERPVRCSCPRSTDSQAGPEFRAVQRRTSPRLLYRAVPSHCRKEVWLTWPRCCQFPAQYDFTGLCCVNQVDAATLARLIYTSRLWRSGLL